MTSLDIAEPLTVDWWLGTPVVDSRWWSCNLGMCKYIIFWIYLRLCFLTVRFLRPSKNMMGGLKIKKMYVNLKAMIKITWSLR